MPGRPDIRVRLGLLPSLQSRNQRVMSPCRWVAPASPWRNVNIADEVTYVSTAAGPAILFLAAR